MNFKGLLHRAKHDGPLTPSEIVIVHNRLIKTLSDSERYTALFILGITGSSQYRGTAEIFLTWPQDPMVAAMAIKALCRYWKLMDDYVDRVFQFIDGVEWDSEDDCRLAAIHVSGDYLRMRSYRPLLNKLPQIFNNMDMNPVIHVATYEEMGRALGIPWNEVPSLGHRRLQRGGFRLDYYSASRAAPCLGGS